MNDVNLSPGSSTRPTSDPGPDPVFTEVQPQEVPRQGWRAFSSKPVKWTIRRFYWLTRRARPFLQLWRHGSDFLYTKNSAMGRSDGIYPKNSARPGSDFLYPLQTQFCAAEIGFPFSFTHTTLAQKMYSSGFFDSASSARKMMSTLDRTQLPFASI